jgi:hypothetical protein
MEWKMKKKHIEGTIGGTLTPAIAELTREERLKDHIWGKNRKKNNPKSTKIRDGFLEGK